MQPSDSESFSDVLRRLARVFPFRGEVEAVGRDYFQVLRKYPLSSVEKAATNWIEQGKSFPKPADLIGVMPSLVERVTLPLMTEAEALEYRRAEMQGYEDDPCKCDLCRKAGVDHRFLRFVPEFTEDDVDRKVFDPIRQREVTAGHWAHGFELQRWYAARDRFWEKARGFFAKQVMPV